jgi:uncharacterized protein
VSKPILMTTPLDVDLGFKFAPLPANWVSGGEPKSRSKTLVRSHDWTSHVVVWECTDGLFKWYYPQDEIMIGISGEAFLVEGLGKERRFGAGDLGYFPAGTCCTWRVPEGIRKVAIIRETMWRPFGFGLKMWNKVVRMLRQTGKSPLVKYWSVEGN